MKIAYASDLHLEHGNLQAYIELPEADMLVLAGDICDIQRLQYEAQLNKAEGQDKTNRLLSLLTRAYDKYGVDNVVYIGGNHEHYGSADFNTTAKVSNRLLRQASALGYELDEYLQEANVRVFEKNGLKFLSGTMFTSFNNADPLEMWNASRCMNDYRVVNIIEESYENGSINQHKRLLSPQDVLLVNHEFIEALNVEKPDVVITHHAPTSKHNDGHGHGGGMLEHMYYCANAQKYVLSDNNTVKLWVSGHTHEDTNFEMNGTRFVSNPRGYYGYESIANNFDFKVVEV